MAIYYKYTCDSGNCSSHWRNVGGQNCYACNFLNDGGNCIILNSSNDFNVQFRPGGELFCEGKLTNLRGMTFNGEYNFSINGSTTTCSTPMGWNPQVCFSSSQLKQSKVTISSDQVQSMGTAVTTAGSGLVHIGIQLMPYAIALTIILIIFGLVKNWSKLKNSWESKNNIKRLNKRKKIASSQLHEMNQILRDPGNDYFYMTYNHLDGDYYLKNGVVYYKNDGEKDEENYGYSRFETDEDFDFIDRKYNEFMRYYDDWKSTGKSHDR